MLILTRKIGTKIVIGGDIEVEVVRIANGQVRLGITAPKHVPVHRAEIQRRIDRERKSA